MKSLVVVAALVPLFAACAYGSAVPADDDGATLPAPDRTPAPTDGGAPLPRDAAATSPERDAAAPTATTDAAVVPDASREDAATTPTNDAGSTSGRAPSVGELVVSEIAYDPSGSEPEGEWFEVTNLSSATVDLRGLTIRDGAARSHTIAQTTLVAPGAFVVLARSSSAAVAPAPIAYVYGAGASASTGIILANGSTGALELANGSTVLQRVPYGSYSHDASGTSIQLRALAYAAVPQGSAFCVGTSPSPGQKSSCN